MPIEGMVDALDRAHRWLKPDGCLLDLRPADVIGVVEIGEDEGDLVEAGRLVVADVRRQRHAAADVALAGALDRGLFVIEAAREFAFRRYGDTVDDLRDHVS